MGTVNQLERKMWLQAAGYRHACFISWPRKSSQRLQSFVLKLKQAIEDDAQLYGLPDSVFSDHQIPHGSQWEQALSHELCGSISMVALCGPYYYESEYCGREWSGAARLGEARLGKGKASILPLVWKPLRSDSVEGLVQVEVLPPEVQRLQCVDLSRIKLRSPAVEESDDFNDIVEGITNRIDEISRDLLQRKSRADCDSFEIPKDSAFQQYKQAAQQFPFLAEP